MPIKLSQCAPLAMSMFLLAVPAYAQSADPLQPRQQDADANLSPECRVPASKLYALAPLRGVRSATEQKHALKDLALGPTSSSVLAPGTGSGPIPHSA